MNCNQLLNITTRLGYLLLENGAEIYRVEESILRIFQAYNLQDSSIFAIPTCLIVTVCDHEGNSVSRVKRITQRGTNLAKVHYLNSLCRNICATTPDESYILEQLDQAETIKTYSSLLQTLAFAALAFFFALFFGGTLADAFCAALCGALIRICRFQMERFNTNFFFVNVAASALAGGLAALLVHFGIGDNLDKIIIGALMNLVPGIAITNFMRDIIGGDLVAGITKLAESLLIAFAIALGTGIALTLANMNWGAI
ncbi:MAG: threonine/serine exporter family protein [Oscillospiraceae bacterium]|nr:threonine/serine exporter family protein [Oscillospiraceae bacterium]